MTDKPTRLYTVQEFPGGQQTFGLAAGAAGVFFADAQGRSVGRIEQDGRLTTLRLPKTEGRPHGLATRDDEEIWLAEWSNADGNRLSRLSASGDSYDFLDLDGFGTPRNVAIAGGDIFFTVGSKLGRLTVSQQVALYAFPGETGWRQVESTPLAVDLDGGVWVGFGGVQGFIARFDPRDETWESLRIDNLQPIGLALAADGELWFTDFGHSQIGRVTSDREIARWDSSREPIRHSC
jgi:virginiamycin B lyase